MTHYMLTVTYETTAGSFAKRQKEDAAIERVVGRKSDGSGALIAPGSCKVMRDLDFDFRTQAARSRAVASLRGRAVTTRRWSYR